MEKFCPLFRIKIISGPHHGKLKNPDGHGGWHVIISVPDPNVNDQSFCAQAFKQGIQFAFFEPGSFSYLKGTATALTVINQRHTADFAFIKLIRLNDLSFNKIKP
jgi:hypothetical protein